MPWFGWVLMGFFILAAGYLWFIAPSHTQPKTNAFLGKLCAHRGLHDGNLQVFENSMKAFSLAVENGYGIEMDVQLTRDHQLVVHHDASTKRVCGTDKIILETNYADLPLLPDGSRIPLFADYLAMVAGRVPLIVEIKGYGNQQQTAKATLEHLRAYTGPYCIESFSPQIVRYFKLHAPDIIRGQLDGGNAASIQTKGFFRYIINKYLLHNYLGRPHFIAYDCNHSESLSLWLAKHLFGAFLVAWTVRDQACLDKARKRYSTWIFEKFTPR